MLAALVLEGVLCRVLSCMGRPRDGGLEQRRRIGPAAWEPPLLPYLNRIGLTSSVVLHGTPPRRGLGAKEAVLSGMGRPRDGGLGAKEANQSVSNSHGGETTGNEDRIECQATDDGASFCVGGQ